MTTSPLVLGPMMRYVDETSASVWVETRTAARVSVRAGGRHWEAGTFAVHGHHYALVELDGLEPGTVTPYALDINGTQVWPDPASGVPAVHDRDAENRQAAADGLRLLPHQRPARSSPATGPTASTRCAPTH